MSGRLFALKEHYVEYETFVACLCVRYSLIYDTVVPVRLLCYRCGVVAVVCSIRASGQQTLVQ